MKINELVKMIGVPIEITQELDEVSGEWESYHASFRGSAEFKRFSERSILASPLGIGTTKREALKNLIERISTYDLIVINASNYESRVEYKVPDKITI